MILIFWGKINSQPISKHTSLLLALCTVVGSVLQASTKHSLLHRLPESELWSITSDNTFLLLESSGGVLYTTDIACSFCMLVCNCLAQQWKSFCSVFELGSEGVNHFLLFTQTQQFGGLSTYFWSYFIFRANVHVLDLCARQEGFWTCSAAQ